MIKCNRCRKEKDIEFFLKNNKELKTCFDCRENYCKSKDNWYKKNKEVVSLYNKIRIDKKYDNTEVLYIYAKKNNSGEEWIKFNSQLEAATKLGVYAANVSKVINGSLKTTGGYIFKKEKEIYKSNESTWEEIKKQNNIVNKCKGQPSNHRTLHETIHGVTGKKCCTCKAWQPLIEYNQSKTHWDNLRVDCKKCLTEWRKENRKKLIKIF